MGNVPPMNCLIHMNIYGIIVGVRACEVIILQMERMDVSHCIHFHVQIGYCS